MSTSVRLQIINVTQQGMKEILSMPLTERIKGTGLQCLKAYYRTKDTILAIYDAMRYGM
jgi:hypothetical protein